MPCRFCNHASPSSSSVQHPRNHAQQTTSPPAIELGSQLRRIRTTEHHRLLFVTRLLSLLVFSTLCLSKKKEEKKKGKKRRIHEKRVHEKEVIRLRVHI